MQAQSEQTNPDPTGYDRAKRATLKKIGITLGAAALAGASAEILSPVGAILDKFVHQDVYNPGKELALGKNIFQPIGVTHTPYTYVKHEQALRSNIEKADFVVVERFSSESQALASPSTTNEMLLAHNQDIPAVMDGFFGGVGRICAELDKKVVVVDPRWGSLGDLPGEVDFAIMFGIPLGLFLTRKKLSRRDLIHTLAFGGLSAGRWVTNVGYHRNENNYGDIVSAEGIDQTITYFQKERGIPQHALYIAGDGHIETTAKYIQQTSFQRKQEISKYPELETILPIPPIQIYTFNHGSWQLQEVPLHVT